MTEKFKGEFRISSIRMQNWDYRSDASYHVTFNTLNRQHFLGEIFEGKMYLSDKGLLAEKYWNEIPEHFNFVTLDEFVIMPDHIHGILNIKSDIYSLEPKKTSNVFNHNDPICHMSAISPMKGSLSTIIGSFKSAVTKELNKRKQDFAWQKRFYESKIDDENELNRLRNYIKSNPKNWK